MKILIQRVSSASVETDGNVVGSISRGIVALIGITHSDSSTEATYLSQKLINLRIFEDDEGKLNRSLLDVDGEVLIVSQFTLYGNCEKGRRPSFVDAARPELAVPLYEKFIEEVRNQKVRVETGVFGANMKISLINDGPITLMLEKVGEGR